MLNYIKGYSEIAFPKICVCCSHHLEASEKFLCSFCQNERFEPAFSISGDASVMICPEVICFRFSLWEFDKGGSLQDLLHLLKYGGMYDLGVELGTLLGKSLQNQISLRTLFKNGYPLLVPVPLHKKRERARGYNQAAAIARGVQQVTRWKSIECSSIERVKNTNSQIGLTVHDRRENIRGAFRVKNMDEMQNSIPVIIDDVFTTGATTFELAGNLVSAGAARVAIGTVARV
ncbi:MAG: ComF family protein [Balneolaceae bacterium]